MSDAAVHYRQDTMTLLGQQYRPEGFPEFLAIIAEPLTYGEDVGWVLTFQDREALKELGFMVAHLLAQTEEAPSEEDAPVAPTD